MEEPEGSRAPTTSALDARPSLHGTLARVSLWLLLPDPATASPVCVGFMATLATGSLVLAVYAALGIFDPAPSPTADLDRCPRCGRPSKALEYHLRKCRGRLGERHTQAFGKGQRRW